MEKFIEFLTNNWSGIVSCLSVVLVFIAILIKRRPKTLSEFYSVVSEALNCVPNLVTLVEIPGNGQEKSLAVKTAVIEAVSKTLGRKLDAKEISYIEKVTQDQIELVLSSPKKGEN